MCDFSLHNVKSRPAKVGDKLTTHNFITGTCGFAAPEDSTTAVCILPGTELAFSAGVICASSRLFSWRTWLSAMHRQAICSSFVTAAGTTLQIVETCQTNSRFPDPHACFAR
jgi:hypothetical protein